MRVVAVALERSDGCILMQKRRPGGAHGGLWEFPGGKVEDRETLEDALIRETGEELAVALSREELRFVASASDGEHGAISALVLFLYKCRRWKGEPQCLAAAEIAWIAPRDLVGLATPPLDRPLIAALLGEA